MCGIAGYVGQGTREQLRRATDAIARRGPDDEGFYETSGVGFGFRRLSIIDLSGGHQPLSNEDGSVWVMLNGEIYNYKSLRTELEGVGHVFATNSDTEVIAHGYELWKENLFERLEGMFAIAIWDAHQRRLMLARDRMGKKPLYYTAKNQSVWFTSELKALLAAGVIEKDLNHQALVNYFRTDAVPTPESIWKNVYKLPPASFLLIENGIPKAPVTFWRPQWSSAGEALLPQNAVGILRGAIDEAVKDRLIADVPVGLFLSGGLDSAVVAAAATRHATSRLQAFTIGFEDASHDETQAAREVAQAFGLDHYVATLSEKDALGMLDQAVECLDEPLADPAIIPQLLLSRFTKERVTVALAGDGGDELLYGYQHVPVHAFVMRHAGLWSGLRPFGSFLSSVPAAAGYFSPGFASQRFARGLGESRLWYRDLAWRGACTAQETSSLFVTGVLDALDVHASEKHLEQEAGRLPSSSTIWQQWSWVYLRNFLMDEVMVKVDRATMWYGLEGRSPLLDRRVVEAAFSIPDRYKLGGWKGKRLFREMLRGLVPDSVLNRPKHGFGVPTAAWLRGPLSERLREVMNPTFLTRQGLFESKTVERWVSEHTHGRPDRRKELWAFLLFQLWYARWHSS